MLACATQKGRFAEMQRVAAWHLRKLKVEMKMQCFRAYVLPVLLFGSETWALTKNQADRLEMVHSACLRQILNVRHADRHSCDATYVVAVRHCQPSGCSPRSSQVTVAGSPMMCCAWPIMGMGDDRYSHQVSVLTHAGCSAAPWGSPRWE